MSTLEHIKELNRIKRASWMDFVSLHVVISVIAIGGYLLQVYTIG